MLGVLSHLTLEHRHPFLAGNAYSGECCFLLSHSVSICLS